MLGDWVLGSAKVSLRALAVEGRLNLGFLCLLSVLFRHDQADSNGSSKPNISKWETQDYCSLCH